MKGIDISKYQRGLDLSIVKNNGLDFVIIRAGFTGWGTGVDYNKDTCFESFYNQAKKLGIPVGAYWYSCANTKEKGIAEANYMYENCLKGKQFEYPVYIDVENSHHQVGNKNGVTDAIIGFCETLENLGYYVGIYASDISGFKDKMVINKLTAYDKWVARYGSKPSYVTNYGMWQYTSKGKLNGYKGNIDMNVSYKDYPSIIKSNDLNGYSKIIDTAPPTTNTNEELQVGDSVKIIGTGNGNSYGTSNTAYGIGWTRKILHIYSDRPYPYQVGNGSGTTGFYKKESLERL